jgi:hypothetical protein
MHPCHGMWRGCFLVRRGRVVGRSRGDVGIVDPGAECVQRLGRLITFALARLKIGGTFAVSTACCDDSVIDYIGIKERG